MSTNQYQEMRNHQQAEVNAFPMFFAFNKQQFAEGMRKLGTSFSKKYLPKIPPEIMERSSAFGISRYRITEEYLP